MIDNKHVSKIIIALMAVAVCICILASYFSDKLTDLLGGTGVNMEYETALFDTDEIISVNIIMDDEDWDTMLSNSTSEEYYVCDVEVNGEMYYNVAIRPKGNTSLSFIASDADTDRYSFKLEFDHYEEGQTCFGLDKLILNNNYADATNMKEAIVYDMYQYLGADASLYNYATVSVNGEYWGVYLALEAVEDSFLTRNYGSADGELYKPETMGMGGGDDKKSGNMPTPGNMPEGMPDFSGEDFTPGEFPGFNNTAQSTEESDSTETVSDQSSSDSTESENTESHGDFNPENMSGFPGGGGGFSMGGNGANLNYTDDELDSYSTIWDGAVTDSSDSDHRRVVTALKNISEGTDLETYMDVDNILKYMAVHTFAVNMDSLSGTMAHNYYLYESDGRLNIIPWDYNLSWGGMGSEGNSASEIINYAIDTPFSSTEFFDALLENEEYLEKYHEYLRILCEEYVNGGVFEETYNRIRSQIDELVATDPNALYSGEEYEAGADMLYKTIMLRAESILGQLDGSIPSTDEGQSADQSSLVDASEIDLLTMGQMNAGGGREDNPNFERPQRMWGHSKSSENEGDESTDTEKPDFGSFTPTEFDGPPGSSQSESSSQSGVMILLGCFALAVLVFAVVKCTGRR